MIFISGDKHGSYDEIEYFCNDHKTTKNDLMIILGDNGVNYYGEKKDRRIKRYLQDLPITFMMIRGNHDRRPEDTGLYEVSHTFECEYAGTFLVEPEYPSLLFTKEFGAYRLYDKLAYVIGGAYSVDKYYRLEMYDMGQHQYKWFYNEQLSNEEMNMAMKGMKSLNHIDYILSHTCPMNYKPFDKLLTGIDQSTVDETMEKWLDKVEQKIDYKKWYCGHWHIDRIVDKVRFMYHDVIELR